MKRLISLFLIFLPVVVLAADPNTNNSSYTPPATDLSVSLLTYLFGMVDGVLHGTGSQIVGQMFGVFNSGVLFLAGIILTYTMFKGVLDTAHEGEFLGRNQSSMMMPIRVAAGAALLLPKASGYCVLQIGIMWLVVQGVGLADNVWNAALNYISRGGVIVAAEADTAVTFSSSTSFNVGTLSNQTTRSNTVASGDAFNSKVSVAGQILMSQVCMAGIQSFMSLSIPANQGVIEDLLAQAAAPSSSSSTAAPPAQPPSVPGDQSSTPAAPIVTTPTIPLPPTPLPDLINSVNLTSVQGSAPPAGGSYTIPMPNLPASSPYAGLNGICGSLTWTYSGACDANGDPSGCVPQAAMPANPQVLTQVQEARTIATQQMYLDLAPTARLIVGNIVNNIQQLSNALPLGRCTDIACDTWGAAGSTGSPTLLTGSELNNAATDYFGIMRPNLNLLAQSAALSSQNQFIAQAEAQGWIMAGSYFFNLSLLNGSVSDLSNEPSNSVQVTNWLSSFEGGTGDQSGTPSTSLVSTLISFIQSMYSKYNLNLTQDNFPFLGSIPSTSGGSAVNLMSIFNQMYPASLPAATGSGGIVDLSQPSTPFSLTSYLADAQVYVPQGSAQAKQLKPTATIANIKFTPAMAVPNLCSGVSGFMHIPQAICGLMMKIFGGILLTAISMGGSLIVQYGNVLLLAIADIPREFLSNYISQTAVGQGNPVIDVARLGIYFMESAVQIWGIGITAAIALGSIPALSIGMTLLTVVTPFFTALVGGLFTVGVMMAYYIPLIPYMLFTFGGLAWMMSVVEAMVAGPIIAFGLLYPSGDQNWGKAEPAIMLMINMFFRPVMMIFGFMFGIILSFVGIWLLNLGFAYTANMIFTSISGADVGYIQIIGGFVLIVVYLNMCKSIIDKSFAMIHMLPDKVLRFIGHSGDSLGAETASMLGDQKSAISGAGSGMAGAARGTYDAAKQAATKEKKAGDVKAEKSTSDTPGSERLGADAAGSGRTEPETDLHVGPASGAGGGEPGGGGDAGAGAEEAGGVSADSGVPEDGFEEGDLAALFAEDSGGGGSSGGSAPGGAGSTGGGAPGGGGGDAGGGAAMENMGDEGSESGDKD